MQQNNQHTKPKKYLSLLTLVMINVIAIDNLRGLTFAAQYGFALVFFYLLAAALFFIPTILVTAELATGWPNTGGVYVWVREAFGPRVGFLAIWLQWIYNVVWYPTIFAFIAGIVAYLIDPQLVNNKFFMLALILTAFWLITAINCFGLKASGVLSVVGAVVGTIFPMVLISCMGLAWVYLGKPSQIEFSMKSALPSFSHFSELAFLANVLFGLMGMEMSAVHAGDVLNPKRNYPRALFYSALIILLTLIFACLAIAIVIPVNQLSLVSGMIDAFSIFFNAYGLGQFMPVIGVLIIVGSLGGAGAWILGPARGLLVASGDTQLPGLFMYRNRHDMPVGILLTQGVIVTVLCAVFLLMPTVNSSYWVLSNLTAQLALIFYIFMFAAAIRLHYKHKHVTREYRIPGGKIGIWLVCGTGIFTCMAAIILGFIPPSQVAIGKIVTYEAILLGGIALCCISPFFIYNMKKANG